MQEPLDKKSFVVVVVVVFVVFSAQNQPQQEWNGIVRELLDRKADIAVAPMTINFARFVTLKYNVLYQKVVEIILFSINSSELRFVTTVATGSQVKFVPAVSFFPKTTHFLAKFA